MNVGGINGATPSGRPRNAAQPASDTASFTGADAVDAALRSLPDSRPVAVDRAKQLISDPTYPSPDVVKQLSKYLAANLIS